MCAAGLNDLLHFIFSNASRAGGRKACIGLNELDRYGIGRREMLSMG